MLSWHYGYACKMSTHPPCEEGATTPHLSLQALKQNFSVKAAPITLPTLLCQGMKCQSQNICRRRKGVGSHPDRLTKGWRLDWNRKARNVTKATPANPPPKLPATPSPYLAGNISSWPYWRPVTTSRKLSQEVRAFPGVTISETGSGALLRKCCQGSCCPGQVALASWRKWTASCPTVVGRCSEKKKRSRESPYLIVNFTFHIRRL